MRRKLLTFGTLAFLFSLAAQHGALAAPGDWSFYYAGAQGNQILCAASRSTISVSADDTITWKSGTVLHEHYLCSSWDASSAETAQAKTSLMINGNLCMGYTNWFTSANNTALVEAVAVQGQNFCATSSPDKFETYGSHRAWRFGAWRTDTSVGPAVWV